MRCRSIITDAAVNIAPTLKDKVHIVQDAIDLAHAMRVEPVRGAILSAMIQASSPNCSWREVPALSRYRKPRQSEQFRGWASRARRCHQPRYTEVKKIQSPVAGQANVLVVPDLEAGNMLAKSLTFVRPTPMPPASCLAPACR